MATAINIEEISGEIDGDPMGPSGARGQLKAAMEWLGKKRQEMRPWSEFVNTKRFSKPKDVSEIGKRVVKNIELFQTNYIMVCFLLIAYCIITSPLLLFALSISFGACFYISQKGQGQAVNIFGRSFSVAEQYALVAVISLPLFFLASAGSAVFWIIAVGVACLLIEIDNAPIKARKCKDRSRDPEISRVWGGYFRC